MFKFITLLKRFIPPYKKYVFLALLFNILTMIFSLFSFGAVIPVLRLLFKTQQSVTVYKIWTWNNSFKAIVSAIRNNLSFTVQHFITSIGPGTALMYLGVFLVVMTAFTVGTCYMGSYFVIPIRTGV